MNQICIHLSDDIKEGAVFFFNYYGIPYTKLSKRSISTNCIVICEEKFCDLNTIKKHIENNGVVLFVQDGINRIMSPKYLFRGLLRCKKNKFYLKYNIFEVFSILMKDENGKFNLGKFKRTFPIDSLLFDLTRKFYEIISEIQGIHFFKWFWPKNIESALILSHDVDTVYGFNEGLKKFRTLENKWRFPSTWFIRPGDRYEVDSKKLKKLIIEGCEIGLHAINDAFKYKKELLKQKRFVEKKINRKIFGVRNHCLVREVPKTQQIEKETKFIYESNIPDTDNCVPNYDNNGCTFFYPYLLNGILILPLTLHDWCFIAGNKYPNQKSMKLYLEKMRYIHSRNGLMTALFHSADYMSGAERIWMYETFLKSIAKIENVWVTLPYNVSEWIKKRESIKFKIHYHENNLNVFFINGVCTLAMHNLSYDKIRHKNIRFFYKDKHLDFVKKKVGCHIVFCINKDNRKY